MTTLPFYQISEKLVWQYMLFCLKCITLSYVLWASCQVLKKSYTLPSSYNLHCWCVSPTFFSLLISAFISLFLWPVFRMIGQQQAKHCGLVVVLGHLAHKKDWNLYLTGLKPCWGSTPLLQNGSGQEDGQCPVKLYYIFGSIVSKRS